MEDERVERVRSWEGMKQSPVATFALVTLSVSVRFLSQFVHCYTRVLLPSHVPLFYFSYLSTFSLIFPSSTLVICPLSYLF